MSLRRRRQRRTEPCALIGLLALLTAGAAGPTAPVPDPLHFHHGLLRSQAPFRLVDATDESGLRFEHDHGGSGRRYMVETMGSGLALADLDGDGWLDAYFAQGSPTPGTESTGSLTNILLRGSPKGRFTPVPAAAGAASEIWTMGVAVADYDNDGFNDIYVSNFGPNQMYRNNGDGTFAELAASARVDDRAWGASSAWADIDNDGYLDLYVANYVDFAWDNHKYCGDPRRNLRAYCHPDVFNAQADRLYRNNGDGTFTGIGQAAGIADTLDGKGLGVVFGDANDDGLIDIYVANDSTRNFLYINVDGRSFVEDGLLAGVSFSSDGQAEAGMGTDWGDYDGDGRLDIVVTNLDVETNSLYRNLGDGMFDNATFASGIGEPSLRQVGFGVNWMDIDNDGDLDLFVANGHIIDNIGEFRDNITYAQRNHLFLNQGHGRLLERSAQLGPGLELVKVSRGSAIGDVDNDGDLDILISNNGQPADFLLNQGADSSGRWIQLRLVGDPANRGGIGARVELVRGGDSVALVREIKAGSSYGSSSDQRLHVGLGAATAVTVRIRWPGGQQQTLGPLQSGHLYVVRQGRGVIAARGPHRAAS